MQVTEFEPSMLDRVQDFECGTDPWQIEVATFLKTPPPGDGAAEVVAGKRARVWLYSTDEGDLIGYACLGISPWWLFHPEKERTGNYLTQVLHFIGVRTCYWSKPDGPLKERYSWRIAEDVLGIAVSNLQTNFRLFPGVGAIINSQNTRARRFAERFGFKTKYPDIIGDLHYLYPLRR